MMTKKRAAYYAEHEKTVIGDVLEAARAKDFAEVEQIFNEYGRFLERHEEAIEVPA